jgi:branched-chain amino acid transport system ATP-binding protein
MLSVKELYAGYGLSEVLVGTSLEVKAGTVVALIGANGAGKTTTMRAVSGLLTPTRGEVRLDGVPIHGLGAARIARLGLAHSPEGRKVFAPLTTEDNLLLGAFTRLPRFFGFRRKAAAGLDRVYALFPKLADRRAQLAGTLSGGEQQMLAIGRALMANPKIMLLDEPSMGLAPRIVEQLYEVLGRIVKTGVTALLVEQNAPMALTLASRGYVLMNGSIVHAASAEGLSHSSLVIDAYLGSHGNPAHPSA